MRAPGAEPVKYRGFLLPSRYEPPTTVNRRVISANPRARLFTAGRVEPDADTVIEEEIAAESVIEGPPRSLVLTVGPQLSAAYGKRPPQLWSPPLDDPIPLDDILRQAQEAPRRTSAPWWPLGEIDRPRQLSHGLLSYSLDDGNVSLMGMRKDEASSVVQTFILSAAARYAPSEIGFYVLSYGGPALAAVRDLPHVGAVGGRDRNELNLRMFGDLEAVLMRRRRIFEQNNILSLEEWRQKRRDGESGPRRRLPHRHLRDRRRVGELHRGQHLAHVAQEPSDEERGGAHRRRARHACAGQRVRLDQTRQHRSRTRSTPVTNSSWPPPTTRRSVRGSRTR